MNEDEVLETDLEEVEPEALSLDQLDDSVEGIEGYDDEEVDDDGNSSDPLGSENDLFSETNPTE